MKPMTDKQMTVDEAVSEIISITVGFEACIQDPMNGTCLAGLLYSIIESQRAQAVEEYKAQNPPVKWLPITDKQKDGATYYCGYWEKGVWKTGWLHYFYDRVNVEYSEWLTMDSCDIGIEPTHYLPVDQIPKPEKPKKKPVTLEMINAAKERLMDNVWNKVVAPRLNFPLVTIDDRKDKKDEYRKS